MKKAAVSTKENDIAGNAVKPSIASPLSSSTILSSNSPPLTAGEQSVARSTKPLLQPKFKIGAHDDKYEQEADLVADQVMRKPDSQGQRQMEGSPNIQFAKRVPSKSSLGENGHFRQQTGQPYFQPGFDYNYSRTPLHSSGGYTAGTNGIIQRSCKECEKEEVQRKSVSGVARAPVDGSAVGEAFTRDLAASRAAEGRSLPGSLRSGFERRFGANFEGVRVVTGETAARLSDSVQARAFTVGNHIWFGRGEYRPTNPFGQRLIAHELAHTLQQRGGGPTLHTSLRVGSSSDPAEVEADQAAEAVMRGQKPGITARSAPILRRQRRRDCSVERGSESNQLQVSCGNERYRVTFSLDRRREPETRVDVTPGINFNDVFFDLEICRGGTRVRVRPSINLTGALRDMLGNLVRRDPALEGVTANPELEIEITISERFSGTIRGGPIIDPRTGDVIGGGATINIPWGQRPEPVDCSRERRFLRLRCERLTTVPGREAQPAQTHDEFRHVFLLFPHAQYNPVREVRLGVENATPTPVATPDLALQQLSAQGFRVQSIEGFTSPEGPREQRRPGGFQGNDTLGEQRAEAAKTWLEDNCPECGAGGITPQGQSELYSPGTTPETEGRPLTRHVTPEFVGGDPLRPDTQAGRDALTQSSVSQQQAQIYPLLRRAHVILKRTVVDQPAQPAVPSREESETVSCPSAVRRAVRDFLGLR
jgi:hypothetical protein